MTIIQTWRKRREGWQALREIFPAGRTGQKSGDYINRPGKRRAARWTKKAPGVDSTRRRDRGKETIKV